MLDQLLKSFNIWTLIIIILALIYQWYKKPHRNFPPLIRGFPGLGIIPYLNDNYPQRIFKKWSLEMKEPVIAVRMGGKDIVVVNTYDEAFEVFCGYRQKIKTKKYFNIPF